MQRRVEGNRRGLLRGAVVGVARAWWWGEGAASSGRTGAPFHVAPRWGASGLSLFHSLRGLFPRRQAGGQRGRRGTVDAGRGGAAYDPARRVPRVSSYTLPRTIDNEPWRTAVVYCREFFGWPTESPAPNSFLRAPSLRRGERRSASHSHHRTTIIGLAWNRGQIGETNYSGYLRKQDEFDFDRISVITTRRTRPLFVRVVVPGTRWIGFARSFSGWPCQSIFRASSNTAEQASRRNISRLPSLRKRRIGFRGTGSVSQPRYRSFLDGGIDETAERSRREPGSVLWLVYEYLGKDDGTRTGAASRTSVFIE